MTGTSKPLTSNPKSTTSIPMTQLEFEQEWTDNAGYVVCHTSGSTGTPKEIHLDKEMMRNSAQRTNEFFGISSGSRLHTCLDFKYIASKMMTVRADVAGCRLTSEYPSNKPLQDCGEGEITLLSVVPSQMEWILHHQPACRLVNILIGGAPIPPMLRRRIAASGYKAWESYGMTETASHIALRSISEDATVPFETLPGITVDANENGCLVISVSGMEDIVTTDLAEVSSPTTFRILGRADNCVISGGVKIIPEMLESALGGFIAFNYCISSVDDAKWGERLVLVVEKGDCLIEDEYLAKAVGVRLNQFKKQLNLGVKSPKEIICIRDFPRTSNGKIDRNALRQAVRTGR